MNLLLLTEEDRVDETTFRIPDNDARATHLRQVLRVVPGQVLRAGLLSKFYGTARVTKATSEAIFFDVEWSPAAVPEPDIDVLLALPRPRLFKRILPELTALGLRRLIITSTARVEKAYFGATALRPERYRPLLLEGLSQARLIHPPTIEIDRHFERILTERIPREYTGHTRLAAHPDSRTDIAELRLEPSIPVLIAIGPEGGFIDAEIAMLTANGFRLVFLSKRILRVETACVSSLAQIDLLRRQARLHPDRLPVHLSTDRK